MIIEHDEECRACGGTGLYVGRGERDGFAVVCYKCNGSGKFHFKHEYRKFSGRKPRSPIPLRVLQVNPGICVGVGNGLTADDYGGLSASEWEAGVPFGRGSEMRRFTCPAWWYQTADYDKKPQWRECIIGGAFSACKFFPNKNDCWARFDREHTCERVE